MKFGEYSVLVYQILFFQSIFVALWKPIALMYSVLLMGGLIYTYLLNSGRLK